MYEKVFLAILLLYPSPLQMAPRSALDSATWILVGWDVGWLGGHENGGALRILHQSSCGRSLRIFSIFKSKYNMRRVWAWVILMPFDYSVQAGFLTFPFQNVTHFVCSRLGVQDRVALRGLNRKCIFGLQCEILIQKATSHASIFIIQASDLWDVSSQPQRDYCFRVWAMTWLEAIYIYIWCDEQRFFQLSRIHLSHYSTFEETKNPENSEKDPRIHVKLLCCRVVCDFSSQMWLHPFMGFNMLENLAFDETFCSASNIPKISTILQTMDFPHSSQNPHMVTTFHQNYKLVILAKFPFVTLTSSSRV